MTLLRPAGLVPAVAAALLAGCGAEVASTAVTASQLQASQAEQATAQAQKIQAGIADAVQRTEAAASAAGGQ